MSNLPPIAAVVQALVPALREALTPILSQLSLQSLLREDDRILRDAILEASCQVLQGALTEPELPANVAQKCTYRWHSPTKTSRGPRAPCGSQPQCCTDAYFTGPPVGSGALCSATITLALPHSR